MRLSFNWLKEYVDLSGITPEELAERLTRSGVEVEAVEQRNQGVSQIVVGHVLEKSKHPDADKLSVCQVDVGDERLQIVCGAENVDAGQRVVVSKVGAVLPGGLKIKKAKLRGVESKGMICSAKELGINDKLLSKSQQDGIMVLANDSEIGADALAYLGLDDTVLELELTPNRSDCLSMIGVAYEVAAILGREVNLPRLDPPENGQSIEGQVAVSIAASEQCANYSARLITDIQLGPSPQWMQNRLMAAGIRPINNIVDITNYVMLEQGQPLHAFDYEKVRNGQIVVRLAEQGEKFVTLDEIEHQLDDEMLLITDGEKPIALAGVMGGANSEVSEQTTTILLESALFSGVSVRKTSKKLNMRSEASLRFEKEVDPEGAHKALDRAALLMAELAQGVVAKGIAKDETKPHHRITVTLRQDRLNAALGTSLTLSETEAILHRLKFAFEMNKGVFEVEIPSRRQDITREVDLVEEVARLHGYDHIPTSLPTGPTTRGRLTDYQAWLRDARNVLVGAGLYEVSTYSFTNEQIMYDFAPLHEDTEGILLNMPMSEERGRLRVNLLPHLLETTAYNKNRQTHDVAIFEIGRVFISNEAQLTRLPQESLVVAGLMTGDYPTEHWTQQAQPVDFYTIKGTVEVLLEQLGVTGAAYEGTSDLIGMHPGRTASIAVGDVSVGYVGQVHPALQKKYDIDESYVFYLDLEKLYTLRARLGQYQLLPRYPANTRDMSILVDESIPASHIKQLIRAQGGSILENVELFDVYTGDKIAKDKKSLAFALIYRKPEGTLTDEEVNEAHERIVAALATTYQAELRS
ncbi:phenylalanine--tRNA ligase subunit beta [Ammoniphilus oxalaticus]|uniref:Phenylalanine--tRNA ligase beta subunit n=1 Tax=Ammoniphilus oxalaticus TaxID=66863 RepID=A0A419SIS3_9BACL|nr:phenylalanine--tRNA ligase subunit beta [Ammoniphilus oxalaticus]RKD23818.1 phenylalanine--tRNA ligase subunit beta [Ammoniphilus oxalaticus]